jgi:dynein heavy chain
MKRKPYDMLDHRKMEYDSDYEDFKRQTQDLESTLQAFIDASFGNVISTERALELLEKFSQIKNLQLDLESKYQVIFQHFVKRDLEGARKTYQLQKDQPPISRNMPPVAGAIAWARQIYRRIEKPMRMFKEHSRVLESPDAKRHIKNFNKLASALIEFETLWHRSWYRVVEQAKTGLQATLLVADPETGRIFVNFDPQILQLIKETKSLQRLGLEVPESAKILCIKESELKQAHMRLQFMLQERERVNARVPSILKRAIAHHIEQVEEAIRPGLTRLSWTSLNLDSYLASIHEQLSKLGELVDKVLDIEECRIKAGLQHIAETCLCDIPSEHEQWSVEEFLEKTERRCALVADMIQKKSELIEAAVGDLLSEVSRGVSSERAKELDQAFEEVLHHFSHKNFEAIVQCTRGSLDLIKSRLGSIGNQYNKSMANRPFFKAEIVLSIPNVILQPKLEDIQASLNRVSSLVLGVSKKIPVWGQRKDSHSEESLRNYHNEVATNKDVVKVVMMLTSMANTIKKEVEAHREQFTHYDFLWKDDRSESIKKFLEANPSLHDFEQEINRYEAFEREIAEIPPWTQINFLHISSEPLKIALTTETVAWKHQYGTNLNQKVKKDMEELIEYMENKNMKLSRKISDLEDIRMCVNQLSEIREMEVGIDMRIQPIEEAYQLLVKHNISVSKDETEMVDSLRYSWKKLKQLVIDVQDNLIKVQPTFKADLTAAVTKFVVDVNEFVADYGDKGPMVAGISPRQASERLRVYQRTFDEINRKWETYSGGEELFGLPITPFSDLVRIKKELRLLQNLYGLYNSVLDAVHRWNDMLWGDVQLDKINAELQDFQNKIRKLPKAMKEWPAYNELKKMIDDFTGTIPLLEMMAHKAIATRHWLKIQELTESEFNLEPESFNLKQLMEAPLLAHFEDIEELCTAAVKEAEIESKLKQVVGDWTDQEFAFAAFKNRGNLMLKPSETSEIITLLEDSLMVLSSLMSNRYNAPFKAEIQGWVQKLSTASEVIENWLGVQNLWIYLEAVFVGGDIAKQLPKEAKRFSNIDKSWQKIMTRANEVPNVIQCCVLDETLGNLLPHLTEQLELCQKSLSGYLEAKRSVFPRFFFVSDPVLLEILGQASDSHTIQAHLKSVFDNVQFVKFHEKEYDKIVGLESSEEEVIALSKAVMAQGNVEAWLGVLLDAMQRSVNDIIREAASRMNDMPLRQFLAEYPAQIGLLGLQLLWTHMSEEALYNAKTDKKIMATTNQKVNDILNSLIEITTLELSKTDRTKYETFVTIHVHQRDVFDALVKQHLKSPQDFEWLKQCRFYWREEQDCCVVSITNYDFKYSCEYLGCTDRLVITPLTDRCYITLAQALGMALGGLPAGPAGTGKTETTKDMGKALGKWVVVFNCSDQMDYRGLGRIYKGLAQSGCWGCFDEFNRIELPVMSVSAQQIACVLSAKRERRTSFTFTDGEVVDLNPEVGIFITMNPGYAGRYELPENLKINFRSVAMIVPDRQIIIRVKLAASGFQQNIVLARKFFVLYRLCEEQLSKQRHYDFGLRNILSVLRTCGAVKRANPDDSESMIIMRVLRDMNISKLVDEDEALFLSLVNDLFPGLTVKKGNYPEVEAAISQRLFEAGLVNYAPWTLKIIQLYETNRVRHGIMVLGPPGAGKTKNIQILLKAMTDCGEPHREMRMNPKAITDSQMFGRLDVATNDWTDGIFSSIWRKTTRKKGEHIWILLDGPVDAVWIENLNSVLDDNKCLTLANGDRITMSPTCKLCFEVHSLANASPATVSRCGMIYMGLTALTWLQILEAWLKTRSPVENEVFSYAFESSFHKAWQYVEENLHPKMQILEVNYIANCIGMLEGLLPTGDQNVGRARLTKTYVFALMWSIGGLLELDERLKFQLWVTENCPNLDLPSIPAESADTFFEFFVADDGTWGHWNTRVPAYAYPQDKTPEFATIIIPTVDNVRNEFLMDIISKQSKSVLLIGEPGTAKTVTIQRYLAKMDPEVQLSKTLNFSSATTPLLFQRTIESYVDKRMGSTYGPPAGKKMTVFVDDVNMPAINEWGDQVTNEIVRQLIEYKGFYNLEKPGDWTSIVDLQFLAAMMHPGGGRNDIPARLKRHFTIFNCTIPSDPSVDKIFGTILEGHFSAARKFSAEVSALAAGLSPITRRLWQLTKSKMLPTPAKFHYIFNLRDLSRIIEGMINTNKDVIRTPENLLQLWFHESSRVIPDRFITQEDVDWFDKTVLDLVKKDLGEDLAKHVASKAYFVDFMRDADDVEEGQEAADPKVYELVALPALQERLFFYQSQYNENIRGANMDLVLFEDAMKHIMRISRIIRTPRGNALLVGVGGSGKQSLTRLSSFIAGNQVFQITISKNYSSSNLMDDLKILYKTAGLAGKPISFIFTDNEVKEEGFLEYINNILTSGEVSNLFPRDEIDMITSDLRPVLKRERPGTVDTLENLWKFFIDRVKKNLHVVLSFSPVGDKFRTRALKFPGLISGCTMDWFNRWPSEALRAVADKFLTNFDIAATPEVRKEVVNHMAFVHNLVATACTNYFVQYRRQTHVTPKSYLSFVNSYKQVYAVKKSKIGELADRMNMGLNKLIEAAQSVAQLQKELVVKEKELAEASKVADTVLAEVTVSTTAAEKVKNEVQKVKDKAQSIANKISADKAVAESQLEAAKPALEEAARALNSIQPAHIATVRKLAKPPHLIMRIMDGVLLLQCKRIDPYVPDPEKPSPKPSWSESLRLMSQSDFLSSLMNFPKDSINAETVELVEPYFDMPDFNLESAKKVSADVAGLCSWVRAMATYYGINKKVMPLKAELATQERRLELANIDLAGAQAQLDDKQAELDKFKTKYNKAVSDKQTLQDDAESCRRKMQAATALISGLGGEKERWTKQSKEFAEAIGRLVGDVVLATAFLSYSGPFNQAFRVNLMNAWKNNLKTNKIPYSGDVDIISLLVDNTTIGEWNIQGLPTDELSIQNGIIVTKASRFPLLIDPQGQGKSWIKNKEEKRGLQITTLTNKYFRQHVEDCLSLGKPLLIEDVEEELDPTLDNILEKNLIRSGRSFKVIFGDKELDFADGFSLYITTKLGNPRYTPEISAKTSIIDFTVTQKGLEDQLLGRVILKEKQELETERSKLLEEVNANKKKMKELEDNLLNRLSETKGSLVDDVSLIEVLAVTKTTSEEVSEKLVVAAETEKKINVAREEYRPVAARGGILYFIIAELQEVNVMYQTSLRQFLRLFDLSMDKAAPSPIPSKRIQNIIELCTFMTFKYVARGLYETHKVLYTLLLALKIDLQRGNVHHEEFRCLIKGGAALDLNAVQKKPFNWITDSTWLNLVALSRMQGFQEILNQVVKNEKGWKSWYEKDAPEAATLPDGYQNSLNSFHRLMLLRSWCIDRTIVAAKSYISDSLGTKFAESQVLDLELTYDESDCRTPLICLLSQGSDPSAQIEALSKKLKVELKAISMGQGQEIHARKLMQTMLLTGGWVLLQNCHLGLNFMDEVLSTLIETESINDKFRLWITTEVNNKFPIGLLQIATRFTNEPPQGIRAGLKRTYNWLTQDMLDVSDRPQYKPLLYAVGFQHTIVQERRKFGPLGWNVPYEFGQADLAATVQFIQNHLDELEPKRGISWPTVRYMMCEVHYGGRVTDDVDRRLLNTYGKLWFGDHMFTEQFQFYKGYIIPNFKSIEDYRKFIEELPLDDTPEVFGLHPNADISCQTKISNDVLGTFFFFFKGYLGTDSNVFFISNRHDCFHSAKGQRRWLWRDS